MVVDEVCHVHEFAEFLCRCGGFDVEGLVKGFGCGEVVGAGADSADAGGELGHEFGSSADAEFFESSEFGDFEIGVFYFACIV